MEFESNYIEKQLDYFGAGGFINGAGYRKKREEIEEPKEEIIIEKGADLIMKNLEELILEFLGEEDLPEEFFEIEKALTEVTRRTLKEAFAILNKYKVEIKANKELKEAIRSLARYVGYGYPGIPAKYPYPVKKELEKEPEIFEWQSFFDFDEEDLEEVGEIEKNLDPDDKFPTLTKNLIAGQRKRDREREKQEIDSGRRFL